MALIQVRIDLVSHGCNIIPTYTQRFAFTDMGFKQRSLRPEFTSDAVLCDQATISGREYRGCDSWFLDFNPSYTPFAFLFNFTLDSE